MSLKLERISLSNHIERHLSPPPSPQKNKQKKNTHTKHSSHMTAVLEMFCTEAKRDCRRWVSSAVLVAMTFMELGLEGGKTKKISKNTGRY